MKGVRLREQTLEDTRPMHESLRDCCALPVSSPQQHESDKLSGIFVHADQCLLRPLETYIDDHPKANVFLLLRQTAQQDLRSTQMDAAFRRLRFVNSVQRSEKCARQKISRPGPSQKLRDTVASISAVTSEGDTRLRATLQKETCHRLPIALSWLAVKLRL